VVVGLPGHTPGHLGVVVIEDERAVLLAGDSSYSQELLLERAIDGVSPNEDDARQTIDRILEFARTRPTVYLVAHDPETGARLERRETLPVAAA
jgi:glyoxylase-like metal-dependent hydrolase (beta-lactamase superfamily II)